MRTRMRTSSVEKMRWDGDVMGLPSGSLIRATVNHAMDHQIKAKRITSGIEPRGDTSDIRRELQSAVVILTTLLHIEGEAMIECNCPTAAWEVK